MRILFALAGLHRVRRGAEVVFESVADEIARRGVHEVTLVGSGDEGSGRAYHFRHCPAIPRGRFERWPSLPLLWNDCMYEELTFAAGLMAQRWWRNFDVTVTCSYPYTNWALRTHLPGRRRPAHVYVTQNGDWAAYAQSREYRLFSCEGLICTNPEYFRRNSDRWPCALIPNGFDPARFHPGKGSRHALGLPVDRPIVLIASALIESKRVAEGIRAAARVPGAFLLIAGDGPLRQAIDALGRDLLPGRFMRRTFAYDEMPDVYRSADAFLHMSLHESFGNVYVEALATGTPIIAHDGPVSRWILGERARLVNTESESDVAAALEAALSTRGDGAGERAEFARSRYAWRAVASQYLHFFEEVSRRAR